MTLLVRWPARPAELRAGLEFSLLLSLFQDKESKRSLHQGKSRQNFNKK